MPNEILNVSSAPHDDIFTYINRADPGIQMIGVWSYYVQAWQLIEYSIMFVIFFMSNRSR